MPRHLFTDGHMQNSERDLSLKLYMAWQKERRRDFRIFLEICLHYFILYLEEVGSLKGC